MNEQITNENPNADSNACSKVVLFMYGTAKKISDNLVLNVVDAKESIQEILALSKQLSKHGCML